MKSAEYKLKVRKDEEVNDEFLMKVNDANGR